MLPASVASRFFLRRRRKKWISGDLGAYFMSRVDFFLSTRKTKVGLLIELSTMVPLDHAVLNGKVVGSHQAYGIPVPGGARAGGRGAPVRVGGPSSSTERAGHHVIDLIE